MTMTAEQVEQRDYTYCSALYYDPAENPPWVHGQRPRFERFLVGTPYVAEARPRAMAFAGARWGVPADLDLYPRNYVREARALLAQGLHD